MFHATHRTKALAAVLVLVGGIGFAGIREARAAQTLVPVGADWKYIDPPLDLRSAGWPGVDDSTWLHRDMLRRSLRQNPEVRGFYA